MQELDANKLDRWITRDQPEGEDGQEWEEVEYKDMPDPCPSCEWVGSHEEGCRLEND